MAELYEHQSEALAVARHRNVLLCSPRRVGKTLLAAMRIREWLMTQDAASATTTTRPPTNHERKPPQQTKTDRSIVVAIVATEKMKEALRVALARLCSELVWTAELAVHPQAPQNATMTTTSSVEARQADFLAERIVRDRAMRVALVSPKLFQMALRKKLLCMENIGLLVLEGADEIHEIAPSLYRQAFEPIQINAHSFSSPLENTGSAPLRIFATTRTRASSLPWDEHQNPLYRHIHVLSVMPVMPQEAVMVLQGHAQPRLPFLLCEPFNVTATAAPNTTLPVGTAVRDYLLGANAKKVDFIRILRLQLELGNSAAVYDEKKKQERVNKFISEAEAVYSHLGLWCLLKYVELELQTNLHACLVDDVDNINRRRRQQQLTRGKGGISVENLDEEEEEEQEEGEEREEETEANASRPDKLSLFIEEKAKDIDEAKLAKIKTMLKVLAWLAASAISLGADAATPRLLKVAEVTRSRLLLSSSSPSPPPPSATTGGTSKSMAPPRCWVFVERRAHCNVVAEYLTFALEVAGLVIPPCCSMLGHSNARIVGALHFSSYLKVITMFQNGQTNLLVTTSIAKKSQRLRVEPPRCDLVVVMDEVLEADKLLDYCHRADPTTGVVKYVVPMGKGDAKKFYLLEKKMKEIAQLEAGANTNSHITTIMTTDGSVYDHQSQSLGGGHSCSEGHLAPPVQAQSHSTAALGLSSSSSAGSAVAGVAVFQRIPPASQHGSAHLPRTGGFGVAAPPSVIYEVVHKDTGAVLNLSNSVEILSKFCDTLPGLDTYDRHAQYDIKRHQVAGVAMSASLKQAKKKKLKYNCNLDDKIDDLKAKAQARADAEDAKEEKEDEDVDMDMDAAVVAAEVDDATTPGRFQYTAKLKLPAMIGAKKEIGSLKVWSDTEAKAIVAFKGCQELLKRGLLDRSFQSKLGSDIHGRNGNASNSANSKPAESSRLPSSSKGPHDDASNRKAEEITDMSTQNSYDLPPVSAAEMGLPTVRSLFIAASDTTATKDAPATTNTISMCFYGIQGVHFAILSSKELYTGNTNTGWRYDFATSDVMEPIVTRVTLQKHATKMELTKLQLEQVLHFHLVTMRLACMKVDDAMRDVDIQGDRVWDEFSKENDKGYLVVPSRLVRVAEATSTTTAGTTGEILELDWDYVHEIISKPLLMDCWPLPSPTELPQDEWVCVPTFRRNVCYVVRALTGETAGESVQKLAETEDAWKAHFKIKAIAGVPIFGRWHKRDQVIAADPSQPLIHGIQVPEIVPLIRRVMQRNHDDAQIAQSKSHFQERYCLPQHTSLLRMTKTKYFEAMGIVPLLYEFERKCQMSTLMTAIGMELDMTLLDDATTKPQYERLEILGDTFLKMETSWCLYENRKDITEEGHLTQLRRDIIRNDRLNMFALAKKLHHFILYPAQIEQFPFKFWKPSCMGKTPESIVAPSKWVADVLEAICGAYLVGQGETGARHFLKWVGVMVPQAPQVLASAYYPDCFPNEVYDTGCDTATLARRSHMGFSIDRMMVDESGNGIQQKLSLVQKRLKYTFTNKLLLLEAMTHPSVGPLRVTMDDGAKKTWRGNYERLEYLGDAVIEYLTLSYAFTSYSKWLPGSLSQWKSATVSNDALGKTAIMCFGVDECLLAGALKIDSESLQIVTNMARKYPREPANGASDANPLERNTSHPPQQKKRKIPNPLGVNALALPKLFADIFEALVAAVFLDSNHNLQIVRDVFLGPLLETVGKDAVAYVCRESGLSTGHDTDRGGRANNGGEDEEDVDMEELHLFSDGDDDD